MDTSPESHEAPARRAVEAWARDKRTPDWLFAAAKVGNGWGIGRELTESEYTDAIHRAGHISLR